MARANRAAALAANAAEGANARERALFLGSEGPEAPGAGGSGGAHGDSGVPGGSGAARRVRRREAAARFGSKSLAALMAVILAVGLMPLPAFGDEGVVINGQKVVAATAASLTTVDADGNVTTESSEATLDESGAVAVDGKKVPALDSTVASLALYRLNRLTAGAATIADLKGYSSASGLSPAAGIAAAAQRAEDEAAAEFDSEDAAIDAQVADDAGLAAQLEALDFSSQRIVVALSEGASLQERDLNNVVSEGSGLYVLQYKNRDAAKRAYIRYTQYDKALFAAPDVQVEASAEDSDGPDSEDEDASDPDSDPVTPALQASGSTQGQLSDEAERRESEEATKAAPERAAVIALIDTAVAADLVEKWNGDNGASASVTRVSVLSDDGRQPDAKTTDEGYQETHGDKMLKSILAANPDARVVSIEALNATGYGSASSVYDALRQAIAAKAAIISMSFAGYAVAGNEAIEAGVEEALQAAGDQEREVALLAAAGNQGADARFFVPASYDGVDAVGALDPAKLAGAAADELKADPQAYRQAASNYGDAVDLWAPGESTSFATATAAGALSDLFNSISPDNRMQALQSVLLAGAATRTDQDEDTQKETTDQEESNEQTDEANTDSNTEKAPDPDPVLAGIEQSVEDAALANYELPLLATLYNEIQATGADAGVWAAYSKSWRWKGANPTQNGLSSFADNKATISYSGGVQQLILTPGVYEFDVYGAPGEKGYGYVEGYASKDYSNGEGGAGGRAQGTVVYESDTTLYVAVGGTPSAGLTKAPTGVVGQNALQDTNGGYNAGGPGVAHFYRRNATSSIMAVGGGGGGATSVSGTDGVLTDTNVKRDAVIVAGGGGGGANVTFQNESSNIVAKMLGGDGIGGGSENTTTGIGGDQTESTMSGMTATSGKSGTRTAGGDGGTVSGSTDASAKSNGTTATSPLGAKSVAPGHYVVIPVSGAGGGGYLGGGSGAAAMVNNYPSGNRGTAVAGGGGGGSAFWGTGVTDGQGKTGVRTAANGIAYITKTADYRVVFSSGSPAGSGNMPFQYALSTSAFTVPACDFSAPSGYRFGGWKVTGSNALVNPDDSFTASDTSAWLNDSKAAITDANWSTVTLVAQWIPLTTYHLPTNPERTVSRDWPGSDVALSESDALALSGVNGSTLAGSGTVFVGWATTRGSNTVQYRPGETIEGGPRWLYPVYSAGTTVAADTPVAPDANFPYTATRTGDNSGATGAIAMRLVGSSFLRVGCKPGASRVQAGCKPTRADEAPTFPIPARRADPRISVQNPLKRASFRDKRAFSGVLHGKTAVDARSNTRIRMQNPQKRAAPPRTCAFRAVLHANPRVGPGTPRPGTGPWDRVLGPGWPRRASSGRTSHEQPRLGKRTHVRLVSVRSRSRAGGRWRNPPGKTHDATRPPSKARNATQPDRQARRAAQPNRQARRAETHGTARRARRAAQPAGRRRRTRSISSASKSATGNTPKAPRARGAGGTLKGRIA